MLRFVMGRKTQRSIPPPKTQEFWEGESGLGPNPQAMCRVEGPKLGQILSCYKLQQDFSLGFELLFKKKGFSNHPHFLLSLLGTAPCPCLSHCTRAIPGFPNPTLGAPLPFHGCDLILCHVTELCLQLLQPNNLISCPPPSPFHGGKQGIANPWAAFGCSFHVPFSPLDRALDLPGVPGSLTIPKIPFFPSSALFLQVLQPN